MAGAAAAQSHRHRYRARLARRRRQVSGVRAPARRSRHVRHLWGRSAQKIGELHMSDDDLVRQWLTDAPQRAATALAKFTPTPAPAPPTPPSDFQAALQ